MNPRNSLVLFLLLVLGLLFVWREEQVSELPQTAEKRVEQILANYDAQLVRRIRVYNQLGGYELLRLGDQWLLAQPENAPVDVKVVEQLVESIGRLSSEMRLSRTEVERDRASFGLVEPSAIVSVQLGEKRTVLNLGAVETLAKRRYLEVAGEPEVHLVDSKSVSLFFASVNELRERAPFAFDPSAVREVVVVKGKAESDNYRFVQDKNDKEWYFLYEGGRIRLERDIVVRNLEQLSAIRVRHFVDDLSRGVAVYGLDSPKLIVRLQLESKDGNREKMIFIGEGPSLPGLNQLSGSASQVYYFKIYGSPWIYEAEGRIVGDFLQPTEHFFFRNFFSEISLDEISVAEVRAPKSGVQARFVRSGDGWVNDGEEKLPMKAEVIELWLQKLLALRALSYPEVSMKPSFGLDEGEFQLELFPKNSQNSYMLRIGNPVGDSSQAALASAPRYGLIRTPSLGERLILLSAASLVDLNKLPKRSVK